MAKKQPAPKTVIEDPSPSKFAKQFVIVAIFFIAVGVLVFFLASALAGGIIALIGAIFGLGAKVVRETPIE